MEGVEYSDSENLAEIVKEIVQAIMILDHNKKPFRQSDIVSLMGQKPNRKIWDRAFKEANKHLDGLGYQLIRTKDHTSKAFFVVNKHRPLPFMYKYDTLEEASTRTLLTLVLAYIFMKNGTVVSEDLLNHLHNLRIYNDDEVEHPYFGNVKAKIFTDFVSQLYLKSSKLPDSELCELSWGPRAEVEISKMSILEFVCECGYEGKIKPENLVSHYERALEEASADFSDGNSQEETATVESVSQSSMC